MHPKTPSGSIFPLLYFLGTISLTIHSTLLVAGWAFYAVFSIIAAYAQPYHNSDRYLRNCPAPWILVFDTKPSKAEI